MSGRVEKVSLERLVDASGLVIVARPAAPPEREEPIDITPPGKNPSSAFPPFLRVQRRYRVLEILFSETRSGKFLAPPGEVRQDDTPAPGELIEVDAEAYEYELGVHRKRYLDRIDKITIREVYDPEEVPEKSSGPRLVFLQRRGGKGWRFAVDPGEEGIGLRDRVETLLRRAR
jgi:hypothetical protein